MVRSAFTKHPASVGESYTEHMGTAFSFAGPLLLAGLCCVVHAVLPFAFEKTGSRMISRLHDRMVAHRVRPENMHKVVAQPAE
ncbi:MAG: DUF6356 family protein [Alphaproteobacteria bacterium]|jgi:hypothetical protein|uniref:DUF6356 family protein n=1 Tax=Pacificispira sp. TaxID=2888761 RepID=UPI001B09006F|nr:hypothetical protein [Alphaproteobacteria bacterium]MBO6862640.1 hypothetical protein [Alphaproteobacteria bacterium]MEC9268033.1 DUF6356 family protein [Pseudomonadota bacterium]